jgi:hypothetical protein
MVICLDDIERHGKHLPVRDILGLISPLKEAHDKKEFEASGNIGRKTRLPLPHGRRIMYNPRKRLLCQSFSSKIPLSLEASVDLQRTSPQDAGLRSRMLWRHWTASSKASATRRWQWPPAERPVGPTPLIRVL